MENQINITGQTQGYSGILPYLPPKIATAIENLPMDIKNSLEEIRLRICRPIFLGSGGMGFELKNPLGGVFICSEGDLKTAVHRITQGSVYALAEEFRRGYIPLPGGHRVGIGGRVLLDNGKVATIRDISSLNFRIAKEIKGCGKILLPYLEDNGIFQNTLIFSPPCCGKTTLLRDLTRLLSDGENLKKSRNITLIDQRSEIAGCFWGQPRLDVGSCTDILDGAPKSQG
ncbi:MAG: stage III sporulation protein AA, partial [Clostridiales bacterium]